MLATAIVAVRRTVWLVTTILLAVVLAGFLTFFANLLLLRSVGQNLSDFFLKTVNGFFHDLCQVGVFGHFLEDPNDPIEDFLRSKIDCDFVNSVIETLVQGLLELALFGALFFGPKIVYKFLERSRWIVPVKRAQNARSGIRLVFKPVKDITPKQGNH